MYFKNYKDKVLYIIGNKTKIIFIFLFLFIIISLFETLSLAIVVPFLSILLKKNNGDQVDFPFYELINKHLIHDNIILSFGIIIILIFTTKLIISILNLYIVNKISWKKIVEIRVRLLLSFNSMKYDEYIKKNSSQYTNQIAILSSVFVKNTFLPLTKIISDFLIIFFVAIFLGFLNIYILITVLSVLTISLLSYDFFFRRKLKKYGYEMDQAQRDILKNINEMFYGFKEIKILNKLNFFISRVIFSSKLMAKRQIKKILISETPRYIYEFIIAILIVSFIVFYSSFLQKDITSIVPTIAVFVLAFIRILPIVSQLNTNLTNLRASIVATETIYEQLKLTEDLNTIKNKEDSKNLLSFKSLKFENVSFGYEKNNKVLNSINFDLKLGQMIGITGDSGTGKTTFVDLLVGLLQPNDGKIYLNDKIVDFSKDRNEIVNISAYLPQTNFIFEDNIIKNISLKEKIEEVDLQKIKKILKKINLFHDVNSELKDRGLNLSGGQKQKISIARSFFSNRQILIMDESTSALDKQNELEILDYLNSIKKEITIIVISHNYETLKYCDNIYKIENKTLKKIQ